MSLRAEIDTLLERVVEEERAVGMVLVLREGEKELDVEISTTEIGLLEADHLARTVLHEVRSKITDAMRAGQRTGQVPALLARYLTALEALGEPPDRPGQPLDRSATEH